jgi:hypothetical protein
MKRVNFLGCKSGLRQAEWIVSDFELGFQVGRDQKFEPGISACKAKMLAWQTIPPAWRQPRNQSGLCRLHAVRSSSAPATFKL